MNEQTGAIQHKADETEKEQDGKGCCKEIGWLFSMYVEARKWCTENEV